MENVEFLHSGTTSVLASAQYKRDTKVNTVSTTGSISVDAIETIEIATSGGSDITRTLPTAAGISGYIVTVKKVDSGAGAVIVHTFGSPAESMDGDVQYNLSNRYQYVRLLSDGSSWHVIGGN